MPTQQWQGVVKQLNWLFYVAVLHCERMIMNAKPWTAKLPLFRLLLSNVSCISANIMTDLHYFLFLKGLHQDSKNSGFTPVAVNTRSAFEWSVLEQAARGDCERSIRGDIQLAIECTVAIPLPKDPLLPVPRYSLANLFYPVVSHPHAITVLRCPRAVPVPRSTHLAHLLSQPIPSAHINLRKKKLSPE